MQEDKEIWDARLYEKQHDFVFNYGRSLVEELNPQSGEYILDLGCGTGQLTQKIKESGAQVLGIDNSSEMILKAKTNFPEIDFRVLNATEFISDKGFDAIFSNATLHWITDQQKVIDCMYRNLKKGGRLVVEMGGQGNVNTITQALRETLRDFGHEENAQKQVWYFPSPATYATLLEQRGFIVAKSLLFPRDTILRNSTEGMQKWLKMFSIRFMTGLSEKEADAVIEETVSRLKNACYDNECWHADYVRLRITAIKSKTLKNYNSILTNFRSEQ